MRVRVYAAIVGIVCLVAIVVQVRADPQWMFDGFAYSIRAQLDAGIPYDAAHAAARAVYAERPAFAGPARHPWLDAPYPQWWSLFAVRAIYPWLASLLWPLLHFDSLFAVSGAAYVAAGLALYAILLRFARPEIAAGVAIVLMLYPESRLIGRSNLTDMLGEALWLATLFAMARFAARGRHTDLVFFGVAAVLLSFTRPVPYMPLTCAIVLAAAGHPRRALPLAAISAALCAIVFAIMWLTRADVPAMPNYVALLARSSVVTLVWFVASIAGPVALYVLVVARSRSDAALMSGVLLCTIPTLVLNPLPTDVMRVVALPMLPAIGCGIALACEVVARHPGSARAAEYMIACSGSVSTLAARRSRSPRSMNAAKR